MADDVEIVGLKIGHQIISISKVLDSYTFQIGLHFADW